MRHGGYTRIVKMAERSGDAAPMALLELIPAEGGEAESKPSTKGKADKVDKADKPGKVEKEGGKGAGVAKGKGKAAAPTEAKPKPKAAVAPKVRKDAGKRAPVKSTAKRSGRSRGGE
jgi:hypothetical protein